MENKHRRSHQRRGEIGAALQQTVSGELGELEDTVKFGVPGGEQMRPLNAA